MNITWGRNVIYAVQSTLKLMPSSLQRLEGESRAFEKHAPCLLLLHKAFCTDVFIPARTCVMYCSNSTHDAARRAWHIDAASAHIEFAIPLSLRLAMFRRPQTPTDKELA